LHEPFGYTDYNKLQLGAKFVILDSGTISEEFFVMGVPAIVPKDSTEPADALDSGSVLLTGPAPNHVTPSISLQLSSKNTASYPNGYSVEDFPERILESCFATCDSSLEWKSVLTNAKKGL